MGIMHKEVIEQRRDRAIIISVIFVSVMIGLANIIGAIKLYNIKLEYITDPIFILTTIAMVYVVYSKCKTSYKYSIMSDKLLIHRIRSKNQKTLENIKMDRIVYFGKDKKEFKKYRCTKVRKYICGLFTSSAYCCVYEYENKYYKFYFQPSKEFINKVDNFRLK